SARLPFTGRRPMRDTCSNSARVSVKPQIARPSLATGSSTSAPIMSRRSSAERPRKFLIRVTERICLRRARMLDRDQLRPSELLEQLQQVALAALSVHVVLGGDRVTQRGHGDRGLYEAPDARTDRIEAVIDGVLEIEDRRLSCQVAGNLVLRCDDRRGGINLHAFSSVSQATANRQGLRSRAHERPVLSRVQLEYRLMRN